MRPNPRREAEERSLLLGGPWASLAQLPRDYHTGLRAQLALDVKVI